MKNILKISITCISLILLACHTDNEYEEFNRNPKNPSVVPYATLFTSATKSLVDEIVTTNYNTSIYKFLAQYWTQTTYIDETNFDMQGRRIPQNHWGTIYRNVLFDLKDAKVRAEAGTSINKTVEIAQMTVLEVFAWQNLVDTFGDIPYTEALDPTNLLPKYDDAAGIYTSLFANLDVAITALSSGAKGFGSSDLLYGGDSAGWKRFANSLKLRMAMRIADVNPADSKKHAEAAIASGVFTSNAHNTALAYLSSPPNTNPIWVSIVQSGRKDYVACKTFVDVLNGLSDPRVNLFFKDQVGGVIVGGPYGSNNTYGDFSHIAAKVLAADFEGTLIDFVEVSFLQAEAVERGYTLSGTAAQHYTNGVTSSMLYWGGTAAQAAAYLATPAVAYATATGDWRQKIATQFWIGMYNRGFEGWNVWRRFGGNTVISLAIPTESKLPVPNRYTYPQNEQQLNETNRAAAASAIGGDTQGTKIFWQP